MHEVEERERETLSRLARAIEYRDVGTSAYLERMAHVAGLIAEAAGHVRRRGAADRTGRAPARHRQDRHSRCGPAEARPADRRGNARSCVATRGSATSCSAAARTVSSRSARLIALRHHERYDGSGYPDGLVGDAIPLEARIVAVAGRVRRADLAAPVQAKPGRWTRRSAYLRDQRGRPVRPALRGRR